MKKAAQALFTRYRLIPPAYLHYLTGDFDRILEIAGLGERWRDAVIGVAALTGSETVIDVGCGTGTLPVLLKRRYPLLRVAAVEPDGRSLEIARVKAASWGVEIDFRQALAEALPFADASFDVGFCSLMLHHVPTDVKRALLRELRRVLRPAGRLVVVDFAPPSPWPLRILLSPLALNLFEHSGDNFRGRIPELIRQAGFQQVEEVGRRRGIVVTWRARP